MGLEYECEDFLIWVLMAHIQYTGQIVQSSIRIILEMKFV